MNSAGFIPFGQSQTTLNKKNVKPLLDKGSTEMAVAQSGTMAPLIELLDRIKDKGIVIERRLTLDALVTRRLRRGLWERAYFAIQQSQELIQTNRDLRNDSKCIVKKSQLLRG